MSPRSWIVLGVLAPMGMLVISGLMLLDLRQDAWDKAEQTSKNLLRVIERDVARNIEIIDLSLLGVVDNLKAPGVGVASPSMRQLILFDRAASARDIGVMLVLDEHGDSIIDASAAPPREVNNADRDYFKFHKNNVGLGLHISKPLISRLTGAWIIVLSRRIDKPDGSFGGIVLGSLDLKYFHSLLSRIGLGPGGAINLYHQDGTRIVRYPDIGGDVVTSSLGTRISDRFVRAASGTFAAISAHDGVERHYSFGRIGDLPLILDVALATEEIEAGWRAKALVIGLSVLALCGLTIVLSLLFGRELRIRAVMQIDLAELSFTDPLTGLSNRRRFDHASGWALSDPRRSKQPVSLLIVDVDHFKRINDRHGHQVGDEVLRTLARCLSASVHRPDDLVCRLGGEEFAVLMPDTDGLGAQIIAEKIHESVSRLEVAATGIGRGTVTVSIGVATLSKKGTDTDQDDLYRSADTALYEAKAGGRNRTRCASTPPERIRADRQMFRRVTPLTVASLPGTGAPPAIPTTEI